MRSSWLNQWGARGRDTGGAAGAGQEQDRESLRVGGPHDGLRGPARGAVRLHTRARAIHRT